ncbi:hypothetical protein [Pseudoflavonifractor phocaeensis]|uniref:hypothetical protein n=1 Tax=Pseudoflavonifractor phocaeensis TaxID=1870988 RepID=UPI0019575842|nr:hypothetical protein [Pseudoflavonifractor phocaeensis]MBM6886505.1 hypothetical protein [Pseudoflavonifractor phocaeensis]
MNKEKWTEKPITWGGYLKFCGVFTVISTIISAVYCIALFEPAWWIGIRKTVPLLQGVVQNVRRLSIINAEEKSCNRGFSSLYL